MKAIFQRLFYLLLVRPWLQLIIGVRFENRHQMQDLDQFILVANHNSHFDAVSLIAALPGSKLKNTHVVTAQDYWGKTGLSRHLTNLFFNAVQINRKRAPEQLSALDVMDQYLKAGKSLILFPEGTRGKPGVLADFKKGVAILLDRNPSVPFVPAFLNGFGRVLPKDAYLIIPLICKVRFGIPTFTETHDIEQNLDLVKDAILSLKKANESDDNQFRFE